MIAISERTRALGYIARSRPLRGVFIAMLVTGIGTSIATPQLTLFLVNVVHVPTSAAGLYYLTNLTAPIAGWVIGSISDRVRSRVRVYRICALIGAAGWILMAMANQPWMPFVINATVLGVAGAGAAQLQATVRDVLNKNPTPLDNGVVATMRIAFALGWIVGPVIGAPLGAIWGLRPLLIGTAIGFAVAALLPLTPRGGTVVGAAAGAGAAAAGAAGAAGASAGSAGSDAAAAVGSSSFSDKEPSRTSSVLPVGGGTLFALLVFTSIDVLVMSGETIKLAYLPLYMNNQLHLEPVLRGAVIGFQPLVEALLMPLAALLASRFGFFRVLFGGAIAAVCAHLCYANADRIGPPLAALIAGQLCMAAAVASFGVLGITVAQRLQPHRVGLASSIFLSAFAINGAVGGLLGSIGAATIGLPHLFWIPVGLSTLGAVALVLLNRAHPLDKAPEFVADELDDLSRVLPPESAS